MDVMVMIKRVISFSISTQTAWKFYWCDSFSNRSSNTK